MATILTSSGIQFSSGNSLTDIPWYTGSTNTNTSFTIGSLILVGSAPLGYPYCGQNPLSNNLNNSRALYVRTSCTYGVGAGKTFDTNNNNPYYTSYWGASALSGTWVGRGIGSCTYCSCSGWTQNKPGLYQRIA